MTDHLIIAIGQLNPVLGDLAGNAEKALGAHAKAADAGADILLLPELFLTGYPIDDLVLADGFLAAVALQIERLAAATAGDAPAIIIGAPRDDGIVERGMNGSYPCIRNSVYVLDDGRISAVRDKARLPNSGVFDEPRIFTAASLQGPVMIRGVAIGLPICEDIWHAETCETLEESGAVLLLSPNGSPFEENKHDRRLNTVVTRVSETGLPAVYVNLVGGQDELVFDGASFAINPGGNLALQMPTFSEAVMLLDAERGADGWRLRGQVTPPDEGDAALWRCIMLGIRDYVEKNRFPGVLLGLSGGIDSALVATLAVDALGPERVEAVMMPSPYTSGESLEDAAALAAKLRIRLSSLGIEPAMMAVDDVLAEAFASAEDNAVGIARENMQSRLRGLMLMSLSNASGAMVLTTGNKSEYAAGYATLYGDMCGGYAPLLDVWKTRVFQLCRWRNTTLPRGSLGPDGSVIPERIIIKPPSAELKPDQKDSDSLPEYEVLDPIMQALVERLESPQNLIEQGYDAAAVIHAAGLLQRSEYKRCQAAPGPKLTSRAFGRDRRYPITCGYMPAASHKETR